jgi:hypothetical protein
MSFGIPVRNGLGVGIGSYVSLSSGGTAAWTPAAITTQLWLDANDPSTITLNTGQVAQWNDKSGNGRDHTQTNFSNQPFFLSNAIGTKPAVQSLAANRRLTLVDADPTFGTTDLFATSTETYSVFAVGNGGDGTGNFIANGGRAGLMYIKGISLASGGTFAFGLLTHDGADVPLSPPRWFAQQRGWSGLAANGAANVTNYTPGALNTNAVVGVVWDGTTTLGTLNGSAWTNSGATGSGSNQNSAAQTGGSGTAGGGNSHIGELIICDTALSTGDRQKLEGYLAWKWGGM